MQRIRKGLYLLEAAGLSNCFLIEGSRGLTLFDTGHPLAAPRLAEEIENNGFALQDLDQIVISHAHCDHSGGAHGLLERRRVKVFAHPGDIPVIQGRERSRPRTLGLRLRRWLRRLKGPYQPIGFVVPVGQGDSLRSLPQWQVLHAPGHTPGSICLFQPAEKALLCGDALNNRAGRLALPPPSNCHDPAQARDSVRKLCALDLDVLGCGHGPVIRAGAGLKVRELVAAL